MKKKNKKILIVINILEIIKDLINRPEMDIIRSRFDTKDEVINGLDSHIINLKRKDFTEIEDLIILFAPTSDLQEISLASGWGEQFLTLSERFDSAIEDLIKEFKINPFSNLANNR